MQFKFAMSTVLIVVVAGTSLASRGTSSGLQSRHPADIKVVTNQLPSRDGAVPVEIIHPTIVSSAPNKVDELRYVLRNNSSKAVLAASVIRTITYEEGGKDYADSVYSAIDAAFHPDLGQKPFGVLSQISMESPGPITFYEGVTIKKITLTMDYVSYADGTADGSGGEGERRINGTREGARRYKSWLVQEYSRAGKSLASILPVIQTPGIPKELKLNLEQTMGADRYRLHLLSTFQKKGAADVENYFK